MNTGEIISLIANIGFPITACIALFIYSNKEREKNTETIDKLRETIQNNTIVVQKLLDRLSKGDE